MCLCVGLVLVLGRSSYYPIYYTAPSRSTLNVMPQTLHPTSSNPEISFFAPAKINIGLNIRGIRDNGYHELDSLMVPLTVGDTLLVKIMNSDTSNTPSASPKITLDIQGVSSSQLSNGTDNLVYRAAQMYLDAIQLPLSIHITLHKNLPLASGLGGGSSDAASTLLALQTLIKQQLSVNSIKILDHINLFELALKLGADVPFFLLQNAAHVQGIGEQLTPVDIPKCWLVLLNPQIAISAKDAYYWFDQQIIDQQTKSRESQQQFAPALKIKDLTELLQTPCIQPLPYLNSLQAGVISHHPQVKTALEALRQAGLCSPLMSGSGSTCFAFARNQQHAEQAVQDLNKAYNHWWCVSSQIAPNTIR